MENKKKIAIIGAGYVGLTVSICLAKMGYNVICLDKNKNKIQKLKQGKVPIFEPGLDKLLIKNKRKIKFTTDLKRAVEQSKIIFICVDTPPKKDGGVNLSNFKKVVKKIAKLLNGYKVIVIKSTVPVGTSLWTKKEIKKYYQKNFSVVSNPEFLREGSAIQDFLKPDRIVLGVEDERAKKVMLDIYSSIQAPKIITDLKNAEMIKYTANAFLATKISFINEIANLCEKVGADIKQIAQGVGLDKRIGPYFLRAGIGYGGSCFPKDIEGLKSIGDRHRYKLKLLNAVIEVNNNQQKIFIKKIRETLKKIRGKTIGIWGLAFKPLTDDIRKSPAIAIVKRLLKMGYKIQVYDPKAMENAKRELSQKNIRFCRSPLEAAKNADVLALLTDWPEFSKIDLRKIKSIMRYPYFLDGRNQFEPEKIKKIGFYYEGIGRK